MFLSLSGRFPEEVLPGHIEILFLVSRGTTILFSIVTVFFLLRSMEPLGSRVVAENKVL